MKLKCVEHNRRLMILPADEEGTEVWVHRTGDMSTCESQYGQIGDTIVRSSESLSGRERTNNNSQEKHGS